MNTQGERIKILRKLNKLSQEQFAKSLHVSYTLVSKIECGKAPATNRIQEQIASIYNININWLLGNSDDMYNTDYNISNTSTPIQLQEKLIQSQVKRLFDIAESFNNCQQEAYIDLLKDLFSIVEETSIMIKDFNPKSDTINKTKEFIDFFSRKYSKAVEQYFLGLE